MNFSRFLEKEKRKRKRERLLCYGLSSRAMDQRGGVRAVHRGPGAPRGDWSPEICCAAVYFADFLAAGEVRGLGSRRTTCRCRSRRDESYDGFGIAGRWPEQCQFTAEGRYSMAAHRSPRFGLFPAGISALGRGAGHKDSVGRLG
jgi:hypothetical protein